MNAEQKLAIKDRIRSFALGVAEVGQRNIVRKLTESNDPWKSISDFQSQFGFRYERSQSAIAFLDVLNVDRLSVSQNVFDVLKTKLAKEIDDMRDDQLLQMLPLTIHFLSIDALKTIPISIIKRLSVIPEKYLHFISKNNFIQVSWME